MKTYKLIIFDWDGTLVDSAKPIVESLKNAAQSVGVPLLSDLAYRQIIGLGVDEAIASLYPDHPVDIKAFAKAYRQYFEANCHSSIRAFDGVEAMLAELKARGFLLAVATGKGREGLQKALEHSGFSQYFSATRTADMTRSKPDPLMLHELLSDFALAPSEALMVGDTSFDIEMAQAAAMDSAAVGCGAHAIHELNKLAPTFMLDYATDLLNLATLKTASASVKPKT